MSRGQPCETCATWRPWPELEWHVGCNCGYICADPEVCDTNFDRMVAFDHWLAARGSAS